jgi:hypothetical protein
MRGIMRRTADLGHTVGPNTYVGAHVLPRMKELIDSVRNAIVQRNWYAALSLALVLPDICGFLESPNVGSQSRYVTWCDRFLVPRYTRPLPPNAAPHVFLPGNDCYALRCAFLHEGSDDVRRQHARQALDSFVFVEPPVCGMLHCLPAGSKLQLQVDIFCEDVCLGVEQWIQTVLAVQPDVEERTRELLSVKPILSLADGVQRLGGGNLLKGERT